MESEVTPPRPSSFKVQREIELNCVLDLGRLRDIAEQIGLEQPIIQLIDNAIERNKAHKFSIAVVGEFKRGKSTFINALLGKEILPADVLPCSATLNRVTYGLQPKVTIIRRSTEDEAEYEDEIALEQLSEYVTKLTPESEERASTIKEAIVAYPLSYCQNNVDIIDTPGLNDDRAMTEVTLGILPEVSAAILVVMATAPFAQSEADFLTNQLLLQDLGRVMFIVTGIDLIRNPKDRQRILETIKTRIETAVKKRLLEQFGSEEDENYQFMRRQIGMPLIFGVSGYDALEARINGDDELLEQSGFPVFEERLEKFITETRGIIELQVLANRIISSADEIIKKVSMEFGALQMQQAEFDKAYESSVADLEGLRERRDQEVQHIDNASHNTKVRLIPYVEQMELAIKEAAEKAIDALPVKPADLKRSDFPEEIESAVNQAINIAARRSSERIQLEIEQDVMREGQRLGDFAAEASQVLQNIEMKFNSTERSTPNRNNSAVAMLVGGLINPFAGGIFAGYQEAGGKGAVVGGTVGLGAGVAGYVALGMLGVTSGIVLLPAVIGVGLLATLAGKESARALFGGDRVERFKNDYKHATLREVENQLAIKRISVEVNEQVEQLYTALKNQFLTELDAHIDQIRSTLEHLRNQKARNETLHESKHQDYEKLLDETQAIRNRAQTLSAYLSEITTI